MRFALLVVATAALALPVSAGAASWTGVVIAKDQARHAVVTASTSGKVRTVRTASAARFRLGRRVSFSARALADGTFRARSARAHGTSRKAFLRAVVVRNQRRAGRVLLSAGGTVVAVRTKAARSVSSSRNPRPGDTIAAMVTVRDSGLRAASVRVTGHILVLKLEGRFVAFDDAILDVEIARGVIVHVRVPSQTFTLPAFDRGERLELIVAVSDDFTFTLLHLQRDDEDERLDVDEDGRIDVRGKLTDLAPATVELGPGASVSCELPRGVDLAKLGFTTGTEARMRCKRVRGVLVLQELRANGRRFKVDDDDDDHGGHGGDDDDHSGPGGGGDDD